jgi:hypothetical protein
MKSIHRTWAQKKGYTHDNFPRSQVKGKVTRIVLLNLIAFAHARIWRDRPKIIRVSIVSIPIVALRASSNWQRRSVHGNCADTLLAANVRIVPVVPLLRDWNVSRYSYATLHTSCRIWISVTVVGNPTDVGECRGGVPIDNVWVHATYWVVEG